MCPSRGLGAALVEQYRAAGWIVAELSRSGSGQGHHSIDLGDPAAAVAAAGALFEQEAQTAWENVILINNAATITPIAPLHALGDAAIAGNLDINVNSAIRLIAAFARAFHGHGARRIVANISSGAARKGNVGWSLYCAAKACTEHFVRALALEQDGAAHPLLCVNINPGLIDSEMQAEIRRVTAAEFPDIERFVRYQETGQLRAPAAVAAEIRRILGGELEQGATYAVELEG